MDDDDLCPECDGLLCDDCGECSFCGSCWCLDDDYDWEQDYDEGDEDLEGVS